MSLESSFINQELKRIATFANYPDGDTPSALALARAGFVYAGRDFRVLCPMCRIEIEKFRKCEDPIEEHRTRSPKCPLAAQASKSILFPSIDIISEEVKNSSPEMLEVFSSAVRRSGGEIKAIRPLADASSAESSSFRVDRENPDYKLLRWEQYRLDTFHDWPMAANVAPKALAQEGLFYTGSGDRVRCAFCRNALHSWEQGDIPSEEHRKYFPNCPFVLSHDVSNVRIDNGSNSVNFAQNPPEISTSLPVYSGLIADRVQPQLTTRTNVSLDIFMTTTTVRAVLEMGFSAQAVRQTTQRQLDETGELFSNAESLLEKLLSLGFEMSIVPSTVASNESLIPESVAPVTSQKQPETSTSCATSAELMTSHNAAVHPTRKENVAARRRKVRKNNKGAASISANTVSLWSRNPSEAVDTTSQANNATSSTTATTAATIGSSEPEAFLEEELSSEEQELMVENIRLKEERTCKVCLDKEVNTVFLPCGHLICCDICSPKVRNCPLCRTFIRGTVKTYLS